MIIRALNEALDRVAQAVSGRRVVPVMPAGRAAYAPPSDPAEMVPSGGETGVVTDPLALLIRYTDVKGEQSERAITVRSLIGNPPTMMLARCHMREASRNFRLDRIDEAVCPETGEVLTPSALLVRLEQGGCRTVDPMLRRAVNILVFLMRCDGTAHPAEWEAIDDGLARYILRFGGSEADHVEAMRFAREVAPDEDDLLIGLRSLSASADAVKLSRWLEESVAGVIEADGTQSEEEFVYLVEVANFIHTIRRPR